MALNALSDLAGMHKPRDPRVAFWKDQGNWPQDAGGYIFAARALAMVGRELLQDEWTDEALATEYIRALPHPLSLLTPKDEIERGIDLLRRTDTAYRQRVGFGGLFHNWDESEFPTTSEWAEAVSNCRAEGEKALKMLMPYFKACVALEQACLQGKLISATRAYAGGAFSVQNWHFWNYQYAWTRFDLCRIDLSAPERLVRSDEKVDWLYFDEASLSDYLKGPQNRADAAAAKVPNVMASPKRRGGRRTRIDWRSLAQHFKDLVEQGQFNAESTTSEIADCLLDHVAESWDELPDKRSVEERVSEWRLANPATS